MFERATQVMVADGVTCALRSDGTVWCWSLSAQNVGNGGEVGDVVSRPEQVRGLTGVRRIYGGGDLESATVCAWRGGADLHCWRRASGIVHDPRSGFSLRPVRMVW